MAPRLKVFEWSDGFHRFTVAASSRPRALAACGFQQDIFASGLAREVADGEDEAAARARPGEVIERGLAVDVGRAEPRSERKKARTGPTLGQKRRVEALAAQLEALEQAHAEAAGVLEKDIKALEVRRDEERRRFKQARDRVIHELEAAKRKL